MECDKGPDSDKDGFSAWVKELRAAFKPKGYLLSAAVSPNKKVIDAGYDVPVLAENLDWIAVMTYDFHGPWEKYTGHVAPLYYHPDDEVDHFNAVSNKHIAAIYILLLHVTFTKKLYYLIIFLLFLLLS